MFVIVFILATLFATVAPKARGVSTGDLMVQRRLYPIQEAADLLGVHRTTLYNKAGEGLITLLKVGGRTYVAADELERFIRDAQPAQVVGRSRRSA